MTNIASGNQAFVHSIIGNTTGKITSKLITFYRAYSGLGLLISNAHVGSFVAIANDSSSSIQPDLKFLPQNQTADLDRWHVISVMWSNKGENPNNCWSNGEKLITFTTGNVKGPDDCYLRNFDRIHDWYKIHLTGCVGEIIAFHKTLNNQETSYIHEYLVKSGELLTHKGFSELSVSQLNHY